MAELTIDNSRLNSMRMNHNLVMTFPFLTMVLSRPSGCCHKSGTVPDFEGMKRAIVALAPPQRDALKQALGVDVVKVMVKQGTCIETVVI